MPKTYKEVEQRDGAHRVQKSAMGEQKKRRDTACKACYVRKKRCVTSPGHAQCNWCKENAQPCLPKAAPLQIGSCRYLASRPVLHYQLDLPLPRGIDHQVPRWSPMYSLYSETLRLLPPKGAGIINRMPQLSFKDSCDPSDAHESSKRLPSSHDSKERESRDAFQAFEIPGENTASRADLEQGRWINDTLASEKLWSEQRGSPAGGNAHVTLKELDSLLLF